MGSFGRLIVRSDPHHGILPAGILTAPPPTQRFVLQYHLGPPNWIKSRTFTITFTLAL